MVTNVSGRSADEDVLQRAIAALQATGYNFASACIQESRVRAQYIRDIQAVSVEFLETVRSGQMSPRAAAAEVNLLRNQILELARLRSSPTGRAFAARLKPQGRAMADLVEKYGQRLFRKPFEALSESQQAAVYCEIVAAAGRGDERVIAMARRLGRLGKRVLFISLAVAAFEVYAAEDKPREIGRQSVLAGAGVAGGWAVGGAALATGACAATAPVCVGIAALVGGVVFAYGADLAFDSLLPKPARPREGW